MAYIRYMIAVNDLKLIELSLATLNVMHFNGMLTLSASRGI